MDIFEQYWDKQLGYTYYKYTQQEWFDKGIDSIVLNKLMDSYYTYEIIETQDDDFFYFPILDKEGNKHRFIDSESDYVMYVKKNKQLIYSFETTALRPRIAELMKEGSQYSKLPLVELQSNNQYVALPMSEFEDIRKEHKINAGVLHLLNNYGKSVGSIV